MKLFVILLFFVFETQAYAQTVYAVEYEQSIIENPSAPVPPSGAENVMKMMKTIKYKLYFDNSKSFSFAISNWQPENPIEEITLQTQIKYSYGVDRETKSVWKQIAGISEVIRVENNGKFGLDWEFFNESIEVNGLKCYRAELSNKLRNNTKVIAWYTKEIPMPFGPKSYYGLPGLILQIQLGPSIIRATKIVKSSEGMPQIPEPTSTISQSEYSASFKGKM